MTDTQKVAVLKSIADETRLSVLRKLAQSPDEIACTDIVNDCALALTLSQPTMSHHFTKLTRSGVILQRKQGTGKFYRLNRPLLESIGINIEKL